MNKAITLIAVFAFTLFSCHQPEPASKPVKKDSPLIGEWMIVGFGNVGENGRVLWGQCNACSLIIFNKNLNGAVRYPDDSSFPFTWSLEKNKLTFKFSDAPKSYGFIKRGVVYTVNFAKKDDYRTLTLLDTKTNFELMLNGANSRSEFIDPESIN